MASFTESFQSSWSIREHCTSLYSRLNEQHHNHGANNYRNNRNRKVWRSILQLHGTQRHSECSNWSYGHYLLNEYRSRKLAVRDSNQSSQRCHRNSRHHTDDRNRIYNYFVKCVLAVTLCCNTAYAQTNEGTSVIANPIASSTGSVTNSAVQINQGSYSTQGFGAGHYCNSGTVVFSPFYLGNGFHPQYTRSENYGAQISISIPLDGNITEICKELGRKRIQKTRVDILLTRMRECTNMYDKGYMIRPESPYSAICDDVVPIAAYSKLGASSLTSAEPD